MKKKEIQACLAIISAAYPSSFEADQATAEVWFQLLKGESIDAAKVAIITLLGEKRTFPPTVGEVLAEIKQRSGIVRRIVAGAGEHEYIIETTDIDDKGKARTTRRRYYRRSTIECLEDMLFWQNRGYFYVESTVPGTNVRSYRYEPQSIVTSGNYSQLRDVYYKGITIKKYQEIV